MMARRWKIQTLVKIGGVGILGRTISGRSNFGMAQNPRFHSTIPHSQHITDKNLNVVLIFVLFLGPTWLAVKLWTVNLDALDSGLTGSTGLLRASVLGQENSSPRPEPPIA